MKVRFTMELDLKEVVLGNRLKLITIKRNTSLFSAQIGVKVGSLHEEKKEKGFAHFTEHMIFKGTNKRSNGDINEELEFIGGDINAFTDYTYTVFCMKALKEDFKMSLELLGDMIINSKFNEEEIEKEKSVILSEIKSSIDDLEDLSFRSVNKLAFSKSGLKYDILGEEKTVSELNRDKLFSFYKKYYLPGNSVLTIASSYDHDEVLEMVEEYFSPWENKELLGKEIISEDNKECRRVVKKSDIEQCSIIYLYTFNNFTKEEELALRILNHKLSDSTNSILFKRLREDKGLVYEVYTSMDTLTNVKTFYIYTQVSLENKEEAENILKDSIKDIIERRIDFDEKTIFSMKKSLKNAIANTLEDTDEIVSFYLYKVLDGEKIESFQEEIDKFSNITKEDIYKAGEKLFSRASVHIFIPK